jgi:HlyD family secretion protein
MAKFTLGGILRASVALVLVLGIIGGGVAFFWGGGPRQVQANDGAEPKEGDEAEAVEIPVKTVHPRYDKTFTMIERRPADVQPYYQADLETRVPGLVSMIRTDIGDIVKKGDLLVEVDVPDLTARKKEREAAWHLAEAQVKQKEAAVDTAKADWEASKAKIKAAEATLKSDEAYYKFRGKQAKRYQQLLADRSIDARLVDEQQDRLEAAFQKVNASRENLTTVTALAKSFEAKTKQAEADLEEAKRKVDVTKAELEFAQSMLDYATVEAPFDGTIVSRNVDPGFFVQNAGNGRTTPLLTIQRNDIVTVVVHVPDNFAPFVTPDTEAIFETASLPGVKIHGKVTRYPPSLVNPQRDRTMIVEVDLWNDSPADYDRKMNDPKFRSGLKKGMPGDPNGGKPILPEIKGKLAAGRQMRLLPGMFGEMTLVLRKFDNAYMLPSSAIVTPGGYAYIYVVKDGKAHLQPVKEQVNDGKLAKVELLNKNGEVVGDLTGDEEVIVSNQGQLSEGQPVKPSPVEDWNTVTTKK